MCTLLCVSQNLLNVFNFHHKNFSSAIRTRTWLRHFSRHTIRVMPPGAIFGAIDHVTPIIVTIQYNDSRGIDKIGSVVERIGV